MGCGHLRAVFVKAVLGSGVWGLTWGLGCKGSAGSGLLGLKSLARFWRLEVEDLCGFQTV